MRLSLAFIVCLLLSVASLAYAHQTPRSEVGFEAIEEVVPQHKKVNHNKKYKVIIVGGGLSGTNAAYNLINKYKVDPAEVLLVEAKDRVGGRTFSPEMPTYGDGPITRRDMGAEFVSSLQRRLNAYLDQFKLKRSPILTGHKSTYEAEDGAVSTSLFIPLPLPFLAKIDFGKGIVKLKFLSDTINLSDLSQTPDALIHDKTTVDAWTQTNFKKPQSRAYFNTIMTMAYGSSTSEMSLLHLMLFIKSIGGVSALPKSGEYHIVQGSQQVSEHLALALPKANLKLNTPVLEIIRHEAGAGAGAEPDEESKGFVEVMTADHTYVADHVIIAVPVPLTKKITFKPELSEGRQRLMDASSMGDYVKVQLVCPTRFWTDSWFLFSGVSEIGPLILFTDGSYSTEHEGDKAMLVGFIAGPKADHFMKLAGQAREREILVKRQVTAMFRITEQPSPVAACEYNEFIWKNQAYSDGVTVRFDLGTLSTVGKHLTAPEGNIHFAGSETATEWHGYMEGALASGERAAKEVAIKLSSSSTSGSPIGIEAPAGNKPVHWAKKLVRQATGAVKNIRIPSLRRTKSVELKGI